MDSVTEDELLVIRFGMKFAQRSTHVNICIFSDALEVVNAVLHLDEDLGHTCVIISDIRHLLNMSSFLHLRYMSRSENSVSNFLVNHAIKAGLNFERTDVWGEVCKRKHDAPSRNSNVNVKWVHAFISEFQCAQNSVKVQGENIASFSNSSWRPPPLGQLRADVDVGYDDSKGLFSVGTVIRDNQENLLAAFAAPIRNPYSVTGGELSALLHGLKLCRTCNISNFWIFSDSVEAVRMVNDSNEILGPSGILVSSIRDMLSEFGGLGLSHMRRQENSAAHKLARYAFSISRPYSWTFVGFPQWLLDLVTKDT